MQNNELLPCPFCGGELKLNTILSIFICNKCKVHIGFPTCYTDKNRIKAVNTRKPMERIVEQLEEKSNDIPIQYERNYEKGFGDGIDYSVDIVRNGGKE